MSTCLWVPGFSSSCSIVTGKRDTATILFSWSYAITLEQFWFPNQTDQLRKGNKIKQLYLQQLSGACNRP